MKKFVQVINSISEFSGQVVKFLLMALIIVLCYEVISRYVFHNPTIWALETSKMLMGTFGAVGWAYTYLHDGHVRVDVFYSRFSRKVKAWINVILSIIFLFPICAILISSGIKWLAFSLRLGEKWLKVVGYHRLHHLELYWWQVFPFLLCRVYPNSFKNYTL